MASLRRQLLAGAAIVITAIFVVLAVILYGAVRHWLVAEFDRGLLAQAQSLIAATELQNGRPHIDFDGPPPAQFQGGRHAEYFELWQSARPAERSPSLAEHDLAFVAPRGSGARAFQFGTLPDGRAGRGITVAFEISPQKLTEGDSPAPGPAPELHLAMTVARDTSQMSEALAHLAWLLAAACGAALLACLGLLAWNIRRSLKPVGAIAGRIAEVGRENLADRLDPAGVPVELAPIVRRLNEMLARLQSAFERERAFTSDVAHELRTPLAGLETAIEVCSARERQPQEYQKTLGQLLRTTRQMHAMVDSLLLLARADAGGVPVSPTPFPIAALIDEAWRPFADRAAARGLRFAFVDHVDRPVHADREKLRQVLSNLFDNAVSYADEGGAIRLTTGADAAALRLTLVNTGSHLSSDQAEQVFDRFWRGDASRTGTGKHCGLGLSITRELIRIMNGAIDVQSIPGGEFTVTVTLPDPLGSDKCMGTGVPDSGTEVELSLRPVSSPDAQSA